ncbi:MAG TPA: DUF418 domain-containing protein [Chitinophagaceae bacterium]|nr:DUF418 domain-containing protein [Chitinophagaceae bacterium]
MIYPSGANQPGGYLTGRFSRYFSLDVLRGIALAGMLLISIREFGGFSLNQQLKLELAATGGNYQLWRVFSVLLEGKMMALLSLVFGAGIVLYFSHKKEEVSTAVTDLYIRRQLWLLFFGIVNAILLLWPGDVLFGYGVIGILLFTCWRLSPRWLLLMALLFTIIYCGKNYWNYSDDKKAYGKYLVVTEKEKQFSKDSLTRFREDSTWAAANPAAWAGKKKDTLVKRGDKDTLIRKLLNDSLIKAAAADTLTSREQDDKGAWEGLLRQFKYDSTADKGSQAAMHAGYGKIWSHLLGKTQGREAAWFYRTGIWEIGAMLLLGMALYKWHFFSSRFSRRRYLLIGLLAIAAGLALAWLRQDCRQAQLADYAVYVSARSFPASLAFPFENLLMATGYAALLLWLVRLQPALWLWKIFAAPGQMALTTYLSQTIMATVFFYGYGMGFYGHMPQWQLYAVAAEIWLIQAVFSVFWLRRYRMGPAEWLWHYLIHWKKIAVKYPAEKQGAAPVIPS